MPPSCVMFPAHGSDPETSASRAPLLAAVMLTPPSSLHDATVDAAVSVSDDATVDAAVSVSDDATVDAAVLVSG
ncbi:hypothetical protein PoB_000108900 [Plakobranchus ocellatus]|uniref:Uncharacterized protein n=1 Tax=Plakobranchus ocellatus TaxID=259542 RepID=A0AAV3XXD0_9GAST|nr:hypothetical protein PoB_000108900 [Plakobranchus ocellatus]